MGPLTMHWRVRYDCTTGRYDVRDLLDMAYGTEGGGKRAIGKLRKRKQMDNVERARWANAATNKGRERMLAKADTCVTLLKYLSSSARAPPGVRVVASWIEEAAKEGDPDLHEADEAVARAAAGNLYAPGV